MATYATSDDVAARWGKDPADLDAPLLSLINIRLGDAERMIRRRIPTLDAQVAAGTVDAEDVEQVECEAVLRLARNPDGYQTETDGNYTYALMSNIASGALEILPGEWEIIGLSDGSSGMTVIAPFAVVGS